MSAARNSSLTRPLNLHTSTIPETPSAQPEAIVTTTVYPSSTAAILSETSHGGKGPDLPIAAIAGGAVGGILLAIAAVLLWHCWGWSIRKKAAEEQKDAFAFLQLRENTRRNASNLMHNYTTYQPYAQRSQPKKVKFMQGASDEKAPINEKEKSDVHGDAERQRITIPADELTAQSPPPQPWLRRPPAAQHAQDEGPSHRTREAIERRLVNARLDVPTPALAHKSSNVSSVSAYSDQSGEEHQRRVPSTLIMAALERLDPRRPLSSTYRRSIRHSAAFSTNTEELNRLSQISAGSAYLQIPSDMPDVQVGLAK